MAGRQVQFIIIITDSARASEILLEALGSGVPRIVENVNSSLDPVARALRIDLSTTGIPVGEFVRPVLKSVAGLGKICDKYVQYAKNGQAATYDATGATCQLVVL